MTSMTTIRVPRETAEALEAQARAQGVSVEAYLQKVAGAGGDADAELAMNMEEFDRWLDELADGEAPSGSLPAQFSRRDIYDDHD